MVCIRDRYNGLQVRREALLAAVGGRTISMHKASSSSSSSHDTSRPSLEALNRDPDKRRRYEVFCAQMASGAPTLSANSEYLSALVSAFVVSRIILLDKVDFNELKEFTKLYEYSREEGSTLDVTNTQGKDSKSTRRKASPEEIAEALRKLQPSRLECNWRAEPLVCNILTDRGKNGTCAQVNVSGVRIHGDTRSSMTTLIF